MMHNHRWRTLLATTLLLAACGELTGGSGWRCDVTVTLDNQSASGSGTGATEQEARAAALSVACAGLGLSGEALNRCRAGQNPGAFSWALEVDCETT